MKAFLAGAFALFVLLLGPAAAQAVIITVNTKADEYGTGTSCSLREAITAAQDNISFGGCPAGFAADTVSLPDGEYKITRAGDGEDGNVTGDFDITGTNQLDIQPASSVAKVIVNGNGIDRVFDKQSSGLLKLLAIQVIGGKLTGIEDGGGIRDSVGILALENVTVNNNSSAYQGGGVAVYGNVQMINSTVSSNRADGNGGGLYVPGGATLIANSSTIFGNVADADENGAGYGGGFAESASLNVSFTNVLNGGNSGKSPVPGDDAYDCSSGPTFFPRYTLQGQPLGPLDCLTGFNPGTNLQSNDLKVDPYLRENGGQTPTHALLPGSPAIGAGGTAAPDECPGLDQNDRPRPLDSCDIGAVQFNPKPKLLITKILPQRVSVKRGKAKVVTLAVLNAGTGPASATRACLVLPRASKRGLRLQGASCRALGVMAVNQTKRAKFRLRAKPKAPRRVYSARATVKAVGVGVGSRSFNVRVR